MEHFEKLGVFYLGRPFDFALKSPTQGLILYESKDLATHSVCIGMTGSGKTGLCVALLEEAIMDNIPSIIIDPKGDMTNLLLTFPELRQEDFRPWINEDDARRKDVSPDEYANQQAQLWSKGLASWGQDGERIRILKGNAEFVIYTPGSTSGVPVSIIKSFSAPSSVIIEDSELLQDRISATTISLLGLIGITADPIKSREYILISTIFSHAWQQGIDLELADLIQQINNPPVSQIGVINLESFFPAKERFELALQLNNLLASPGFATWLQGESLDIDRILYTSTGKPKVSIFSINHLNDAERMFFVSLLLNQILSWTRAQSGTTSLRALLYMDEIFGYFPPVSNPPSKGPLLTLLKQARAFGLGIVLTTQNPVDLDYKGLANIGTWFIGRLQTERDKMRVLEGLEGTTSTQGMKFDRKAMEETLAGLGKRVFLMHNVHNDAPIIFETRWCMSYLRGPLTRNQIKLLMEPIKKIQQEEPMTMLPSNNVQSEMPTNVVLKPKSTIPILPPDIQQFFVPAQGSKDKNASYLYRPFLIGHGQLGFKDVKTGIQILKEEIFMTSITEGVFPVNWENAQLITVSPTELHTTPIEDAFFADLPPAAKISKNYSSWTKDFTNWLYHTQKIQVLKSSSFNLFSQPGETERDFRIRLQQSSREKRDQVLEKLRQKYATKITGLNEKIRRSELAVQQENEQAKQQRIQTVISVGSMLMSSLMGKKPVNSSSLGKAVSATRGASRYMKEKEDTKLAKDNLESHRLNLQQLEDEFKSEADKLVASMDPFAEELESHLIKPAKKDILVKMLVLGWVPYYLNSDGTIESAWQ